MKKVILCFHGFKTGEYHDFALFNQYLKDNPTSFDGEIDLVHFYDVNNPKTFSSSYWKTTVSNLTKKYLDEGYEIYLIGFSYGAIVASYIAAKFKVKKMILLSPSFKLIGGKMISTNFTYLMRLLKMRIFHNKRLKRFRKSKKKVVPFKLVISIFYNIYANRKYVKKVKCESLVVYGLDDNYVPISSANYGFAHIKSKHKQLWFIDQVNHLFIFSSDKAPVIFERLLGFINGETVVKSID
jgi:esterase/lipase